MSLRRPSARSLARNDSGQASIETAVSLVLSLTTCFWLFEMVMLVHTYAVLNQAAQEGIRYAIMHGADSSNCSGPTTGCTDTSGTNVSSIVRSFANVSFHDTSAMSVNVSYPEATGSKAGSLVSITINYSYVPYLRLPFTNSLFVKAQGRIIY